MERAVTLAVLTLPIALFIGVVRLLFGDTEQVAASSGLVGQAVVLLILGALPETTEDTAHE